LQQPFSSSNNNSRPSSATPKIAVDQIALDEIIENIRKLSKQIKILQRRKLLGIVVEIEEEDEDEEESSERKDPNTETEPKVKVDPIMLLEEERHRDMIVNIMLVSICFSSISCVISLHLIIFFVSFCLEKIR
jgi:CO dehydrogenase/acetyl-CoA synthase beta subunit